MRIRSIKPEFWRDPDTTGRWPADLKLFYIGMWMVADDSGRFVWDDQLIASDLYPFERDADVSGLLRRLLKAGVVVAYEVAGRRYGYLPNFTKHQRINRPTESKLPEPSQALHEDSVSVHGGLTAGKDQGSGSREQGSGDSSEPPAAAEPPVSPVVASLPCVGHGPAEFAVTQRQAEAWSKAFPGCDVLGELRRMRAWAEANPTKRKTHKGTPAFVVRWLSKAQDGHAAGAGGKPAAAGPRGMAQVGTDWEAKPW